MPHFVSSLDVVEEIPAVFLFCLKSRFWTPYSNVYHIIWAYSRCFRSCFGYDNHCSFFYFRSNHRMFHVDMKPSFVYERTVAHVVHINLQPIFHPDVSFFIFFRTISFSCMKMGSLEGNVAFLSNKLLKNGFFDLEVIELACETFHHFIQN
jgi:hypothetical protein